MRLEGADAGARLVFEYLVPGACWSPSYTVWLDGGEARIAMRAMVAQRTGEDWSGVPLTLSTAEPDRWVELPELTKRRIGRAQPAPPKRAYRAPPEGADALFADYDRAFAPPSRHATEPAEDFDTPTYARSALEQAEFWRASDVPARCSPRARSSFNTSPT